MMRTIRLSSVIATVLALLGSLFVSLAGPAQAGTLRNGVCESGEFCYYYNSNHYGSLSDLSASLADYGDTTPSCYVFKSAGAGQGQCQKNNAASVWNRTGKTIRVHFNSNYGGTYQAISAGAKINLNATLKNNNASHRPPPTTSGLMRISYGLYRLTGGSISAPFDGYQNTDGRHEGIDIDRWVGSPVKSLIAGKVTRVTEGYRGSSGLSQIAIYNSNFDKTIIYLHTNPLDGLYVGQSIGRGQRIGTEDWRGVSRESASHTHVEMRRGKRTGAAESVCTGSEVTNPNDPCNILENPNPTTFWKNRGYDSLR